jgi:hypothetical protein
MGARYWSRLGTAILLGIAVGVVNLSSPVVSADTASNMRTLGDAEAFLQTELTANAPKLTAPAGPEDVHIDSYSSATYCASGWHVVNNPVLLGNKGLFGSFETRLGLLKRLDSFQVALAIDGITVVTERSANKRIGAQEVLDFLGADYGYWSDTSALIPPGSLSVGTHTLRTTFTDPMSVFAPIDIQISFFLDGQC